MYLKLNENETKLGYLFKVKIDYILIKEVKTLTLRFRKVLVLQFYY